jgi:hypothetical protein
MFQSFKEYLGLVLIRWWTLVVGVVGGGLGISNHFIDELIVPLWGWVLIAALGFSVAQFLAFHKIRIGRGELVYKRGIRQDLGQFLEEGQQIEVKCANQKEDAPIQEAEEWAERVATYLAQELGEDYAISFYSSDGLPVGFSSISSLQHRKVSGFIGNRLARLNEFLREFRR